MKHKEPQILRCVSECGDIYGLHAGATRFQRRSTKDLEHHVSGSVGSGASRQDWSLAQMMGQLTDLRLLRSI